jgi:endonuclease/exonuclease/phosphatase family metal-dependent hydrolase
MTDAEEGALFASYNIHKCVGSDRRFDPERTAAVIGEIGADVLALQETDRRFGDRKGLLDLAAIERGAGLVPVPVTNAHGGHGWHGNLVLVREALLRDLRQVALPGLEPRGALVADLDLKDGPVRHSSLHAFAPTFGPVGRGTPSFPSYFPVLALDRILARPWRMLGPVRAHDTPLARKASDHLPIKARVRIDAG